MSERKETGNYTEISKGLYSTGGTKGRKPKPTKAPELIKKIDSQLNKQPIVTLGVFNLLPKSIAIIIHNKVLYKNITLEEKCKIAEIILKNRENAKCFVYLTEKGEDLLENIKTNNCKIDFRSIFNTQERQLLLG